MSRSRPTAERRNRGLAGLRGPRALGTVLLCLLASATNLVHLVAVRHATCAVHAEVIHAPADEAPVSPRAATPELTPQADPDTGHGEDHCRAFASRRRELPVEPPQVLATHAPPAARGLLAHAPLAITHRPNAALLLVAPKTSPPV